MPPDASRLNAKRPLHFHLVLLVVTCVLPVVGFSAALMIRIYTQQWRDTGLQLEARAHLLTAAVDRELQHARSTLQTLGMSARLRQRDYAGFYAEATAVAQRMGTHILLADAEGNQIFHTTRPFGTALPRMVNAEAARRVASSGKPEISDLFTGQMDGRLLYTVLVPAESDGRASHVLALSFPVQALAEAIDAEQVPHEWRAVVLDRAGRILWRSWEAQRFVGKLSTAAHLADHGERIQFSRTSDGIATYALAVRSPLSGWTTVVGVPSAVVDAALVRSLATIAGGGTLVLVLGLLLSTMIGRRLQRSVDALAAAAAALGRGEAIPTVATPVRELAALAETLHRASDALAQERGRRDAAEALLRHSEASLAHAQRIAAIGSWEWETGTGAIVWSEAMFQILQLPAEDAAPSRARLIALVHPNDRPRVAAWLGGLARARATSRAEFRIQRADGAYRYVHCESEAVRDSAGQLRKIAGTMQDITERKEIEEELARAKAEAESANRAKSDFLANMSHELRTPLNAVIGFADIIENERVGALGNDKYREYASHIRMSGEHLLELITDILDFAKVDAGKLVLADDQLDVVTLVGGCIYMVEPQAAEAGLRLVTSIAPEVGGVCADERRFKQILLNLLSNAIKFTPRGGSVSLRAQIESGGGLVIEVVDTGIGIAEADIERVLQPFAQVDNSLNRNTEGTGLGLPLTKHLVELHGGTLTLASTPGAGTTVTVHLPAERVLRRVA